MKLLYRFLKVLLLGIGLFLLGIILLFGRQNIPLEKLKAKYAPNPSQFIAIDGMDVHYRDEGNPSDSIPIILIHGTGSSLHTFDDWTSQLIPENRVIRMDLPAYGLTGPFPNRDYALDNYISFLDHFLAALEIKKCILAGNSFGGSLAWNFAKEYPEKVERLILINSSGYPSESNSTPLAFKLAETPILKNLFTFITPRFVAKSSVENVFADKSKVTEELVDRYFELTLRKGNRQAFIDRMGVKGNTDRYKNIKLINQKTLILWGKEDNLIPVKMAHRFHSDLPNDTLIILENIGHVPMEESPFESLKPVMTFLKD